MSIELSQLNELREFLCRSELARDSVLSVSG
jgi:hypothetical protein